MKDLFLSVLEISLSTSVVILALLLFSRVLSKRYLTKWKYFIWIALALRLAVPIQLELPEVTTIPRQEIVFEVPARIAAPIVQSPTVTLPTAETVSTPMSVTPLDVMALIWLVGCILFLLAHLGSYLVYRRRVMVYGHRTRDLDMLRLIRQESKALGISTSVPVRTYAGATSPMILGFLRPILVLPDMKYRPEELEFILRHELIHLKRHDMFCKLLFVIANAVHWFNPIIYLMRKEAVVDMELSCDERVVENTGYENRKAYTETLLATLCRQHTRTTSLSSQFYGGKQVMKKRFRNILGRAKKKNGKILLLFAVLIVILFGAIIRIRSVDENDLTPVGDDIFYAAWDFSEAFAAGDEEAMRACLDDTYAGSMEMYPNPISDPEEAKFKFSGMEDTPKFGDISNNSFLWPSVFDKTVPLGCTYTVKMRGNSTPDGEHLILSLINREDGWKIRDYTFEWGAPPAAETLEREDKRGQLETFYHDYIKSVDATDYAYRDMDGDGLDELLIYCRGELDIVTVRDGKAESLLSAALYDNGFFLCEDNVIGQYSEGGGGSTYWFYRVENQQLQHIDCLVFLFNESAWYRSSDYSGNMDTLVSISEEERKAVADKYAPLDSRAEDFMKPLLGASASAQQPDILSELSDKEREELENATEVAAKFANAYFSGDMQTVNALRVNPQRDWPKYHGPAFDYQKAIDAGFLYSSDIIQYSMFNVNMIAPYDDLTELYSTLTLMLNLKGTGAPEQYEYFVIELSKEEEGWLTRDFGFGRVATAEDNRELARLTEEFADAYFSGNVAALKSYMAEDPSEYSDDGAFLGELLDIHSIKGVPQASGTLIMEEGVTTSVEFHEAESPDSYTYLTIDFIQENRQWKIDFYGLEK